MCADLRGSGAWNRWPLSIVPQFEEYQMFEVAVQQSSMDDAACHGYPFDNADVTESYGVEVGPLPQLAFEAWGKEPD
jgi:hypothetical protein